MSPSVLGDEVPKHMGSNSSHFIRQVLRLSAAMVLGGLVNSAGAQATTPAVLGIGTSAPRTLVTSFDLSHPIEKVTKTYQGENFEFLLETSVYRGSALNPFLDSNNLVFAYQLTFNTAPSIGSSNAWGITELKVFDYFDNLVAVAEQLTAPDGVVPGPTWNMGGHISFTFPPISVTPGAPPIYAGQSSNMLLVFTNASEYTTATAMIVCMEITNVGLFDESGMASTTKRFDVDSLGPVAISDTIPDPGPDPVADSASTGILILAALAFGVAGRRVGRGDRL